MIVDQLARENAIDPSRSFTVTAPAGSGKTELLTQRYLSLLAVVEQPESILAITFTRKAVAEMRARIVAALEEARLFSEEPFELPAHRRQTIELAQAALKADQERQWGLLDNPARMRVYTFDAFSASLVRQMPIASRFGGNASPAEHPEELYQLAIEQVLAQLGSDTDHAAALDKLLLHMNVRVQHLANLLMQLLAKRDQWRALFANMRGDPERAVAVLYQWFCEQIEFSLSNVRALLLPHEHELCSLMNFANVQLREHGSPTLLPDGEEPISALPQASADELSTWRCVAQFLLTKQGLPRATVNIRQGFPPKKSKPQYTVDDFKALILSIEENRNARAFLADLHILPNPNDIERDDALLRCLMEVLHLAMAYLELEFQKRQQVDFVATSLHALESLADNSDLAMKLDYSIQHILVDEFQDTSQLQYDLLDRLCQEWTATDVPGRSLFLVGDAMQSIYSFRNARVALFMHARAYGLAAVRCENLELQSNFRSEKPIIDWLNHCFKGIFPAADDLRQNASAYVEAACAVGSSNNGSEALAYEFALEEGATRHVEAQHISSKVQSLQALYPNESIAILVRNRTHARHLLPVLRASGVAVAFTDFERLLDQPIVADLLSLTRLLLNPADQIAWYAFLRSPLMSISLSDLLAVSMKNCYCVRQAVEDCLQKNEALSDSAHQRLTFFLSLYDAIVEQRQRKALITDLAGLWNYLGGDFVYTDKQSRLAYQKYLSELLVIHAAQSQPSWESIQEHMSQLRVKSEPTLSSSSGPGAVELMTMHKAKGLEFDSVVLPALDLGVKSEGAELLTWTEQFVSPTESTLLLGLPGRTSSMEPNAYDYVREQNRIQSAHESARLLYVACSRARKRLYVYRAYDPSRPEKHSGSSLAALLWPHLPDAANTLDGPSDEQTVGAESIAGSEPMRTRGPVDLAVLSEHCLVNKRDEASLSKSYFQGTKTIDWVSSITQQNNFERSIGIVVHKNLQLWVAKGREAFWRLSTTERRKGIRTQLLANGLRKELTSAVEKVEQALLAAREDQRHQWLFAGGISEAEYRITEGDTIRSVVIDRLVDDADGNQWIVDYKTHLNNGATKEELSQLAQVYLSQLKIYQQAVPTATRTGVYFVLQQTLIELA